MVRHPSYLEYPLLLLLKTKKLLLFDFSCQFFVAGGSGGFSERRAHETAGQHQRAEKQYEGQAAGSGWKVILNSVILYDIQIKGFARSSLFNRKKLTNI